MKLVNCVFFSVLLSCGAVAQAPEASAAKPAQTERFDNATTASVGGEKASMVHRFSFDQPTPSHVNGYYNQYRFNAPGFSWGNAGGWSVQHGFSEDGVFNTRGIGQMYVSNSVKHATGDFAAQYTYASTDGGATAQSDEGFTLDTREGGETDKWFHGTAGAGAAAGTTLLPVNYVADAQSQQETTDGAYMLDISKGTISGVVTGPETLVEGTSVHVMPVTAKLPVSTGIGIVRTAIPVIKVPTEPESITLPNVRLLRGSFVPGKACLAGGWYPEQVVVTKVGRAGSGTQDVTIIHKNPNGLDPQNPTSLWQGGVCGQYLSLDRNIARDGFPTSYEVVGATDSSHLAYVWNVKGSTTQNVLRVYHAPVRLKSLTRSHGVVTASFMGANQPYIFNHAATVVIAGASDPSFNGEVHLPKYDDDLDVKLSWQQPGPDTTASVATINMPPAYFSFHLYPGAEVLGPALAGGVPLEPNSVDWAPGDVIQNPHNPSFNMVGRRTVLVQHTLNDGSNSFGQLWAFYGSGISANYFPSAWRNANPCSMYSGCGGTLEPILWSTYDGPYFGLIAARYAPLNQGALFSVGCDPRGCDHKSPYRLFQLQNGRMDFNPADGTFTVPRLAAAILTTSRLELQDSSGKALALTSSHGHLVVSEQSSANSGYAAGETARVLAGPANRGGSAVCARGYTCNASRGRITLAAAAAATGTVASVRVPLQPGTICTATQNGGASFFGIGSGEEGASGFNVTAGVPLHGVVTVDYSCR